MEQGEQPQGEDGRDLSRASERREIRADPDRAANEEA